MTSTALSGAHQPVHIQMNYVNLHQWRIAKNLRLGQDQPDNTSYLSRSRDHPDDDYYSPLRFYGRQTSRNDQYQQDHGSYRNQRVGHSEDYRPSPSRYYSNQHSRHGQYQQDQWSYQQRPSPHRRSPPTYPSYSQRGASYRSPESCPVNHRNAPLSGHSNHDRTIMAITGHQMS